MTCDACVKTITARLLAMPHVTAADVSLEKKSVHITASSSISLQDVQKALIDLPKYSVSDETTQEKTWFETYKPLLTVFVFVFLVSTAYQISLDQFSMNLFMNHIMAGFFIGLSFFKFLDLKSFAESFSNYDPIAQRFLGYGKIYPFLELGLGLLYISSLGLTYAHLITAVILSITTYGVIKRLKSKSPFQCACLGTGFSLPLSSVTVIENVLMITMAIYGLTYRI